MSNTPNNLITNTIKLNDHLHVEKHDPAAKASQHWSCKIKAPHQRTCCTKPVLFNKGVANYGFAEQDIYWDGDDDLILMSTRNFHHSQNIYVSSCASVCHWCEPSLHVDFGRSLHTLDTGTLDERQSVWASHSTAKPTRTVHEVRSHNIVKHDAENRRLHKLLQNIWI